MNRHDEIQAVARDIASNVHADPEARNRMADDLIKLVGLMLGGMGKYLATEGEYRLNDVADLVFEPDPEEAPEETAERQSEFERDRELEGSKFRSMYLTGERIQDSARELTEKCQGADLERYHRPTGNRWCKCGHSPLSHHAEDGTCIGESHNKRPCYGGERDCTGFDAKHRDPVWVHEDRRPAMFRHTDARGALIIPPELIEATTGVCCHEGPLCPYAGQDRMSTGCCYPLGGVCPEHC